MSHHHIAQLVADWNVGAPVYADAVFADLGLPYAPLANLIMEEVAAAIESGVSLTMQDLTPEAQATIRTRHPDGDLPIVDLDTL